MPEASASYAELAADAVSGREFAMAHAAPWMPAQAPADAERAEMRAVLGVSDAFAKPPEPAHKQADASDKRRQDATMRHLCALHPPSWAKPGEPHPIPACRGREERNARVR